MATTLFTPTLTTLAGFATGNYDNYDVSIDCDMSAISPHGISGKPEGNFLSNYGAQWIGNP
jgi:hypothetical protein